jgi:hypothetical protein
MGKIAILRGVAQREHIRKKMCGNIVLVEDSRWRRDIGIEWVQGDR